MLLVGDGQSAAGVLENIMNLAQRCKTLSCLALYLAGCWYCSCWYCSLVPWREFSCIIAILRTTSRMYVELVLIPLACSSRPLNFQCHLLYALDLTLQEKQMYLAFWRKSFSGFVASTLFWLWWFLPSKFGSEGEHLSVLDLL